MSALKPSNSEAQLRQQALEDADSLATYIWPFHYPIRLFVNLVAAAVRLISPFIPELAPLAVPFAVFVLALPVIALLSASAGWLVWKSVAVGWEAEVNLQYGSDGSPHAEMHLPSLIATQPYDVSMHLVVPANEANFALGNFMTSLTLSTPSNKTLAFVRKSAIVLPPSSTPWSFFYNRPGTVDVTIPLLSSFVASTSQPFVRVELGRQDQWRSIGDGHGRELSVISALLRGVVVHRGVRGLIGHFPLFFALIATGVFFFISFMVLAACLLPALEWRFRDDSIPSADTDKPRRRLRQRLNMPAAERRSPVTAKAKATKRRGSTAEHRPPISLPESEDVIPKEEAKEEQETTNLTFPPSSAMSGGLHTPLRRRRSRVSPGSSPSSSDPDN